MIILVKLANFKVKDATKSCYVLLPFFLNLVLGPVGYFLFPDVWECRAAGSSKWMLLKFK